MNKLQNIYCYTNLDIEGKEEWPNKLPIVPRVGDHIRSLHVWKHTISPEHRYLELKVVKVLWISTKDGSGLSEVKVELGAPDDGSSIRQFRRKYEWITGIREYLD